jgi:DNA end-binding protein Ku
LPNTSRGAAVQGNATAHLADGAEPEDGHSSGLAVAVQRLRAWRARVAEKVMPRSIWNGTITVGLIAVPVKVSSAVQDKAVHFHQVHAADGVRIKQRRVCSKEGKEVPYKQVAKGYAVSGGEYVLLSADEIAAAAGDGAHRVSLEEFVCAHDIDPDFFARTYYLGAGADGEAAYRLLHDGLARTDRAGIGRWVFHNREYLVAVRAREDVLMLHTMRFADELVGPGDLDIATPIRAPSKRETEMAAALVDSLHEPFEPNAFKDTHRAAPLALIKRKAKGEEIELPEPTEPGEAPDLLAALQASLSDGKRGSKSKAGASKSKPKTSRKAKR